MVETDKLCLNEQADDDGLSEDEFFSTVPDGETATAAVSEVGGDESDADSDDASDDDSEDSSDDDSDDSDESSEPAPAKKKRRQDDH